MGDTKTNFRIRLKAAGVRGYEWLKGYSTETGDPTLCFRRVFAKVYLTECTAKLALDCLRRRYPDTVTIEIV